MKHLPPTSIRYILNGLIVCIVLYALVGIIVLALSQEIADVWATISFSLLLKFFALLTISLTLRSWRWCYLNKTVNPQISWNQTAGIYIGGLSMVLTPGRVGELWRAWALNRHQNIGFRKALPIILCDRLFDLNALLIFAAMGVWVMFASYQLPAVLAIILLCALFLLLFKPMVTRTIIKIIWQCCGKRWSRQFASLLIMARHVIWIVRPANYLPLILLSLGAWGVEGVALFYIVVELNGVLNYLGGLVIIGLGNIAGIISLLPGGIGGYDVAMIYLLQAYGNTLALAVSIGFIRIAGVLYATLIGLPFLGYYTYR